MPEALLVVADLPAASSDGLRLHAPRLRRGVAGIAEGFRAPPRSTQDQGQRPRSRQGFPDRFQSDTSRSALHAVADVVAVVVLRTAVDWRACGLSQRGQDATSARSSRLVDKPESSVIQPWSCVDIVHREPFCDPSVALRPKRVRTPSKSRRDPVPATASPACREPHR